MKARFLTLKELAERWAVSHRTIEAQLQAGTLPVPCTKIGGLWRFPITGVERYEREQTVTP